MALPFRSKPPTEPLDAATLRKRAEAIAAPFPVLLAEAERVAAVVAQGVHGRRRAGQGEAFWQYRSFSDGDNVRSIDWRRSARSDHYYVRENEWEAANTVWFWRDGSPGMDWRSSAKTPTKKDRATIIQMALASLLMRAGERCAVIGESNRPRSGRAGLERLALRLAASEGPAKTLSADIPAFARMVIASDFLEAPDVWRDRLARLSARPARGVLLHIIDRAEDDFPYSGRVQMRLPGASTVLKPYIIGRAERAKAEYQTKFLAHKQALADIARRLNWTVITHYTDQPAAHALTALYTAIEGDK